MWRVSLQCDILNDTPGPWAVTAFEHRHSQQCNPGPDQFAAHRRRQGHSTQLAPAALERYALLLRYKTPMSARRECLRELLPPDVALDAQQIFNIGVRVQRQINLGEVSSVLPLASSGAHTPSWFEEMHLAEGLVAEAMREAITKDGWVVSNVLDQLARLDNNFRFAILADENGRAAGIVYMTSSQRALAASFGDVLFLDLKMGAHNKLRWPFCWSG